MAFGCKETAPQTLKQKQKLWTEAVELKFSRGRPCVGSSARGRGLEDKPRRTQVAGVGHTDAQASLKPAASESAKGRAKWRCSGPQEEADSCGTPGFPPAPRSSHMPTAESTS